MKKFGFTLAEVLVAIGIIGVVAAITLPTLVKAQESKVLTSTLSTAITDFENATTTLITQKGCDNIFETETWKNISGGKLSSSSSDAVIRRFMGDFGKVLPLAKYTKKASTFYTNGKVKNLSGSDISVSNILDLSNQVVFETKKGIAYCIYIENSVKDNNAKKEINVLEAGGNLYATAATVAIDVNGAKKPNIIGKDIYFFMLGCDGLMYPYGGIDVAIKTNDNKLWSDNSSAYACTDSTKKANGVGCTARLIEQNYKLEY